MSRQLKRVLDHYRSLGAEKEIELFRTLYRCLRLRDRLRYHEAPAAERMQQA